MPVVAIIGASSDRYKFGNKALRAFRARGYEVIPINPNEKVIEGAAAYASIKDVPGTVDLATLYVQPDVGERLLDEIAEKGVPEVWINPGAGSASLVARARALGLKPVQQCSIVAIGESPSRY